MTSRDVIHSFFVPDFRIKQDVLPGRYTETWFEATKPGRYQILCARVLRHLALADVGRGRGHGRARVRPVDARAAAGASPARVDTGGDDGPAFHGSIVEYGKQVAMAQGCVKCHSLDGEPHIGPTWLDLYQRRRRSRTARPSSPTRPT